jgi:hypothetical protein
MRNAILLIASLAVAMSFAAAAESQAEQEAKQAAAEEAAEKLLPEDQQFGKPYSGTFNLSAKDDQNPQVIGRFAVDKGATYLVKLNDPGLLKRLSLYDNKKCTLTGKLRNEGKYLLVTTVIESAPTPPARRKRGGL